MCLRGECLVSLSMCCWCCVKLRVWVCTSERERERETHELSKVAISWPCTLWARSGRRGRSSWRCAKINRQAKEANWSGRARGKPQAGAECKVSMRQLLSSSYASPSLSRFFCEGQPFLQIASACRNIVLSAQSGLIKPVKITPPLVNGHMRRDFFCWFFYLFIYFHLILLTARWKVV